MLSRDRKRLRFQSPTPARTGTSGGRRWPGSPGATPSRFNWWSSIHAPAQGATRIVGQPAHHGILSATVSIHAPAQGATYCPGRVQPLSIWRKPRSPALVRAEEIQSSRRSRYGRYCQSTPPHRGRRRSIPKDDAVESLFVTMQDLAHSCATLATSIEHGEHRVNRSSVSIHAPAQGATPRVPRPPTQPSPSGFNPRPRLQT